MTDPSTPSPPAVAPVPAAQSRNIAGLVSFALAVVAVFVGLSSTVVQFTLLTVPSVEYNLVSIASAATNFVAGLLSIAAVVVGVVGLLQRSRGVGFAAAGTAVGASNVLQLIVGLTVPFAFSVLPG